MGLFMAKQVILGAHFPGVNNHTVWSDPASGSQIAFSSFAHLARTAEAGLFDFFFLAEGLRLREQGGKIHDLDVVGRPNTMTVLAAVAAVTEYLGLAGTIQATYNEPYEIARQFATLDHLSGGRAAWNVVTSPDAFTGENFRRGGYLERGDRYARAAAFVQVTRELWESWAPDAIAADKSAGQFLRPDGGALPVSAAGPGEYGGDGGGGYGRAGGRGPGAFRINTFDCDISGNFTVPRSPQVHPVLLQAGDSDGGREFAAHSADGVFTRHSTYDAGRAFYADVKSRLARYGRSPDSLKVLPGASFILGDTQAAAKEYARYVRRQQVSPQTAILLLEQVWNTDLSSFDPEGPLPPFDPDPEAESIIQGRARMHDDKVATARKWRAIAEEKKLSIRDLIIEVTARENFVGTPSAVAEAINRSVQDDACDGFILVPHLVPGGLDEFVAKVVPLLQERGVLRAAYEAGTTLRDRMGLEPFRPAASWAAAREAAPGREAARG
jgi:alkanesulfonate monooxygenase SsuD/methylene tetrahydromethanopterin reductase-like flavin-dependent oxidoreductase (luciferase family)